MVEGGRDLSEQQDIKADANKKQWHLWLVGILTLLWNGSGTYTFLMAQAGKLTGLSAEEQAYYADQPLWFAVSTDIALLTAVAAGVALLLRSGAALWFFAASFSLIILNNLYELISGASRMLVNQDAIVLTTVVIIVAALQLAYTWVMRNRGAFN